MNRVRLCFVLDSYPPAIGGAESALQSICEGLARQNFTVTIITSRFSGDIPGIENQPDYTVVRLRIPRRLRRFWFFVLGLPVIIRSAGTSDVIIGSTYGGVAPAFIASVLKRKKRVMVVHEVMRHRWFRFEKNFLKAFLYSSIEKILVRFPFHKVIAVSEYTRNELLLMNVSSDVVHHGISAGGEISGRNRSEARAPLGFRDNDFLYLSYGRLGVTKGFQYLAHAIPAIIERVPRARFLLVFSDYDRRIRHEVDAALAKVTTDCYRVVDSVSHELLIEYIAMADCIVVPSLSEGFGFAALEACAAGKSLVATNAGAIPEIVYGKYILVEPGSAERLAEGCCAMAEGSSSYTEPKDFRWEVSIEKWKKLLLDVSGEHGQR